MSKLKKILIVDNDIETVETIKTCLSIKKEYKIDKVYRGKDALEQMKKQKYDLIILDVMMPGMSGIEVSEKMTKNKDLKKIPVILCSALPVDSKEFKKSQDNFGELSVIKDTLEKPFEVKDLLSKVSKNIKK